MRDISISLTQRIYNRINCRVNFTRELHPSSGVNGRYVVTSEVLFAGKNPSIAPDLRLQLAEAIEKPCIYVKDGHWFNSIGGWTNPETNEYFVGANLHFFNLESAVRAAQDSEQVAIFDKHTDKVLYISELPESVLNHSFKSIDLNEDSE